MRPRRDRPWRVVVGDTQPIYYRSRYTALKGAVWYADHYPADRVRVQRYDPGAQRFVGYTETRGQR